MERFTVTGSNIPNAGEALAIPVAVISPSDIANSGVETNVLDVLRKISPAISGIGGENATIATAGTGRRLAGLDSQPADPRLGQRPPHGLQSRRLPPVVLNSWT
jgi:hypothetical protein